MEWLFNLVVIIIIACAIFKEANKPLWKFLADKYQINNIEIPLSSIFNTEIVFFWDEKNSDLINAMHVMIEEEGLAIRSPITKPYIKSIIIPWKDLNIEGEIYRWLHKRLVLSVKNTPIKLAILYIHKNDFLKFSTKLI